MIEQNIQSFTSFMWGCLQIGVPMGAPNPSFLVLKMEGFPHP